VTHHRSAIMVTLAGYSVTLRIVLWIRMDKNRESCLPVEIIPHGIDLLGLRHDASARCVGDANMRWGPEVST
jgi:hypothetical protein